MLCACTIVADIACSITVIVNIFNISSCRYIILEDSVISQTEPVDAMYTKVKHEISTEASNMTITRRVKLREQTESKATAKLATYT